MVLLKQFYRRVAGWRRLGDYPGVASYTFVELLKGLYAGSQPHIVRPMYKSADGHAFHDHKGFNWRVLRDSLSKKFVITKTVSSPVSWLPPDLASQVWFVAVKRTS
jgi:hypothetical protein